MNYPTNEPAVKLNGIPGRVAGQSDVFISGILRVLGHQRDYTENYWGK